MRGLGGIGGGTMRLARMAPLAPWAAWLLIATAGAVAIALAQREVQRAAFETDARIAHRVLSQRLVQHDAILAALALLQPGGEADSAVQRLSALYPQVLRVLRREGRAAWSGDASLAAGLLAAEQASRAARRAALGPIDSTQGRYWLVQAASPAAFALQIEVASLLVPGEWPLAPGSPARATLQLGREPFVLQAGRSLGTGQRFEFDKVLAVESQAFELSLDLAYGAAQWPWAALGLWAGASGLAVAAVAALWRQRRDERRARELLRVGQAGRLNALGELAAGIAHELNQPLTAVLANTAAASRLLADQEPDLATARQAMDAAAQQGRRAADVLGRLRRLIARPQGESAVQALRLAPRLAAALDLLEGEIRRLGLRPQLTVEPPQLAVKADAVALEQIVHNLLTNALHALAQVPPAERRLELAASIAGNRVRITVRDSGPGITAAALPRLFEPFFTTRSGAGGLGLGLSLSETLAMGMGGSLAGGNAVPRGAEFCLELPDAELTA